MGNNRSNRAGHVLATALRRLDLSVTVRAFRDIDFLAAIEFERFVYQFRTTLTARHRPDAHSTFIAFVNSHLFLLV
jgi:hypothetical protein